MAMQSQYLIIHPYWLSQYVDDRARAGLTPDVRVVAPGVDGAPLISNADLEAGCVVIKLAPGKLRLAWEEALMARLDCTTN